MSSVWLSPAKRNAAGEGGWVLRWRENGRQRSETLRGVTKAEAKLRVAEKRRELALPEQYASRRADDGRLVRDVVEHWRQHKLPHIEPSTAAHWLSMLDKWIPDHFLQRRLSDITRGDVRDLLRFVAEKRSTATVAKVRTVLRSVFDEAVDHEWIPTNPVAGIRVPQGRKGSDVVEPDAIPTPVEVQSIIDATDAHWRPLVQLLAWTGIRIGEAAGLRVGDVDLQSGTLRVERSRARATRGVSGKPSHWYDKRPKTDAGARTLRLPAPVVELLRPLVVNRAPGEPLFVGPRGARLDPNGFRNRVWAKALRAAGLDGYTPHDLRHFTASTLIGEGCNAVEVAHWLGHADATTTLRIYAKCLPGGQDHLVSALERAFTVGSASAR